MGVNQCNKVVQSGHMWKTPIVCVFSLCQTECLAISDVINVAPLCVTKVLFSCLLLAESINIGQVGITLLRQLRQLRTHVHLSGFARKRILVSKRDSTAVVTTDFTSVLMLSVVCILIGHCRMRKNWNDIYTIIKLLLARSFTCK